MAHAGEQDQPDIARRRQAWFEDQPELDPARLIFIDKCGTSTRTARMYGRAPRGERCRAPVPHGHWKTTTLLAGLTLDGILAPMTIGGAMTGAAFLAYVEQVLAPTLRRHRHPRQSAGPQAHRHPRGHRGHGRRHEASAMAAHGLARRPVRDNDASRFP